MKPLTIISFITNNPSSLEKLIVIKQINPEQHETIYERFWWQLLVLRRRALPEYMKNKFRKKMIMPPNCWHI